jgi:hypothetical protein
MRIGLPMRTLEEPVNEIPPKPTPPPPIAYRSTNPEMTATRVAHAIIAALSWVGASTVFYGAFMKMFHEKARRPTYFFEDKFLIIIPIGLAFLIGAIYFTYRAVRPLPKK